MGQEHHERPKPHLREPGGRLRQLAPCAVALSEEDSGRQ